MHYLNSNAIHHANNFLLIVNYCRLDSIKHPRPHRTVSERIKMSLQGFAPTADTKVMATFERVYTMTSTTHFVVENMTS